MIESKIVWLLVSTLISNTSYAFIAPFVPIELVALGIPSIGLIAVAFSAYPLAILLLTPLFTRAVPILGNTNMISVAIATTGAIFITFGHLTARTFTEAEYSSLVIFAFTFRFV